MQKCNQTPSNTTVLEAKATQSITEDANIHLSVLSSLAKYYIYYDAI